MRNLRHTIVIATLAAAFAFPLGVLASHTFSDVSTSSTFHADIEAIAKVGVTTGCAPDKYCPKEYVTREQMAAFLNRLGSLDGTQEPVVNAAKLDGADSTDFIRTDVEFHGQASCLGKTMVPSASDMAYGTSGSMIYATGAYLTAFCQFHLPDDAKITAFQAVVLDNSSTEEAGCTLERQTLTNTNTAHIAGVGTTDPQTPGVTTLETTDNLPEVVDNNGKLYSAYCHVLGSGTDIGIVAAIVQYSFTGMPVE